MCPKARTSKYCSSSGNKYYTRRLGQNSISLEIGWLNTFIMHNLMVIGTFSLLSEKIRSISFTDSCSCLMIYGLHCEAITSHKIAYKFVNKEGNVTTRLAWC